MHPLRVGLADARIDRVGKAANRGRICGCERFELDGRQFQSFVAQPLQRPQCVFQKPPAQLGVGCQSSKDCFDISVRHTGGACRMDAARALLSVERQRRGKCLGINGLPLVVNACYADRSCADVDMCSDLDNRPGCGSEVN